VFQKAWHFIPLMVNHLQCVCANFVMAGVVVSTVAATCTENGGTVFLSRPVQRPTFAQIDHDGTGGYNGSAIAHVGRFLHWAK
jgi:hypothetical protein